MACPICFDSDNQSLYKKIDGIDYHDCGACQSIYADASFLQSISSGSNCNYDEDYWSMELRSAKYRSYGDALNRVAEVFLYARIPVKKFLDIGCGPGYLLDSLSVVLPSHKDIFHGVELFPPPAKFRSTHENYFVGSMADLTQKFSAGVCIEVIEHLTPDMLRNMVNDLRRISEPGAIYYFNSGQPDYVKNEDNNYLDPLSRGHIVSYSIKGLEKIFSEYGFTIIPLPGRTWGFLAEYSILPAVPNAEDLLTRLWTAHPANVEILKNNGFGPLMYVTGVESARCYLEHAIATDRGRLLMQNG